MTRRLLAVLVAGALVAAPTTLRAQGGASVVVAGGISLPVNELSDEADAGYNIALGLNFGAPYLPVGARLEAGLNGFNTKRNTVGLTGDVRIASGTANAIFNTGPTSSAPYLIGGLGIYNRRITTIFAGTTADETRNVAGVNVGGGIRFPLGGLTTFLEARYHLMLGNRNDLTNYQFVPVTFGVQF